LLPTRLNPFLADTDSIIQQVTLFFCASVLDIGILVRLSCRRRLSKPLLTSSHDEDEISSAETPTTNEQKKNQLATIVLMMLPLALIGALSKISFPQLGRRTR
jgi:hypothetical protein